MSDEKKIPEEEKNGGGKTPWRKPVAMAKDSNVVSWLLFAGLVFLSITLYRPLAGLYWKAKNRDYAKEIQSRACTASSFLAISYEGVADNPPSSSPLISTELFKSHILALKEAGYTPIGLDDVRKFYLEGAALPDKAILTTFENCRKTTYFGIRDFLLENRWIAAMGVVTKPVRENSGDVILRPYLKSLLPNIMWDLAAQSDGGTGFITVSPDGEKAPFFSALEYLPGENRLETPEEFGLRIEKDHLLAIEEFKTGIGTNPVAFFFPEGNYGQYGENNRFLRKINLDTVKRHYSLGFVLNNFALNDRFSDRFRLNRMRVRPGWDAKFLLSRLESSWQIRPSEDRRESLIPAERLVGDWGLISHYHDGTVLRAAPPQDPLFSDEGTTSGARAWIMGANTFREGSVDFNFRLSAGDFSLYLCHTDEDNFLKFTLSEDGQAILERRSEAEGDAIIAKEYAMGAASTRQCSLIATLRDGLVFMTLNGKPLFGGAVRTGKTSPGMVGLGVWSERPASAEVFISDLHLSARTETICTWNAQDVEHGALIRSMLDKEAFRYTAIAPPLRKGRAAEPSLPSGEMEALRLSAKKSSFRILPSLEIDSVEAIAATDPAILARKAEEDGFDGITLDCANCPEGAMAPLADCVRKICRAFEGCGLEVALRLPGAAASHSLYNGIAASHTNVLFVSDGAEAGSRGKARFIRMKKIVPPAQSGGKGRLFYRISDIREENVPGGAASARRMAAKLFEEGDYVSCISNLLVLKAEAPRDGETAGLLAASHEALGEYAMAATNILEALDCDPGRIGLVSRAARLLLLAGRRKDAEKLIDSYAGAFPGDPEIALVQAMWLKNTGRGRKGAEILSSVLERDPKSIKCRIALQDLLESPAQRYANLEALAKGAMESDAGILSFAGSLASSGLLAIPEAAFLAGFANDAISRGGIPAAAMKALGGMRPNTNTLSETFLGGELSSRWTIDGNFAIDEGGAFVLKAAPGREEAEISLSGSEFTRDGFIEATVKETSGDFWLCARKGPSSMVRYGFGQDGYLRIQAWHDGEIAEGDSVPWIRPAKDIAMRLEIKGCGAIGYLDGKKVFRVPLKIPRELAFGAWALSTAHPKRGYALLRLGRLASGPMKNTIFLMEGNEEALSAGLEEARLNSDSLSVLSPALFSQNPDGSLIHSPAAPIAPFRMLSSYNRIRLLPAISLSFKTEANPDEIASLISTNKLEGAVLLVKNSPGKEWMQEMTAVSQRTDATIIVAKRKPEPDGGKEEFTLTEIPRGDLAIMPYRESHAATPETLRELAAKGRNGAGAAIISSGMDSAGEDN